MLSSNLSKNSEPLLLAIDPGSDKCGLALVAQTGVIAYRSIVARSELISTLRDLVERHQPCRILCGMGTGSKPILKELEAAALGPPLAAVDESYTSEAARARYLAENPPRGLERLMPAALRTPPGPVDDYVAVILAERYWAQQPSPNS